MANALRLLQSHLCRKAIRQWLGGCLDRTIGIKEWLGDRALDSTEYQLTCQLEPLFFEFTKTRCDIFRVFDHAQAMTT